MALIHCHMQIAVTFKLHLHKIKLSFIYSTSSFSVVPSCVKPITIYFFQVIPGFEEGYDFANFQITSVAAFCLLNTDLFKKVQTRVEGNELYSPIA